MTWSKNKEKRKQSQTMTAQTILSQPVALGPAR